MSTPSNIYLVSDLHLGAPNQAASLVREKHFVKWLNDISGKAKALYLMGDIFDFWFEYGSAVPKGYIRMQGKLAELADQGVDISIFAGNHDLWYRDYFQQQLGATIYHRPIIREFFGQKFYLAHGDGLGPGDYGYKFLKFVLTNPVSKWLFARLHPNLGIGLARLSSGASRHANEQKPQLRTYKGKQEYLYAHLCEVVEQQPDIQFFVFGHRHIAVDDEVMPGHRLIILGDWINHFTYLEINEHEVALKSYPMEVATS